MSLLEAEHGDLCEPNLNPDGPPLTTHEQCSCAGQPHSKQQQTTTIGVSPRSSTSQNDINKRPKTSSKRRYVIFVNGWVYKKKLSVTNDNVMLVSDGCNYAEQQCWWGFKHAWLCNSWHGPFTLKSQILISYCRLVNCHHHHH